MPIDHKAQDKLISWIRVGKCPDCKSPMLKPGPCGGNSMNVSCDWCGARFNAHGANYMNKRDVAFTFAVDRLNHLDEDE